MKTNLSFFLKSLGCKQNHLEGQIIENELIQKGFKKAFSIASSDIYILNSCAVTSHTISQVNYLLNKAKKQNPNIKTVLAGCCAQTYKIQDNLNLSNIDLILGNSEKLKIEKYIDNLFKDKKIFVEDIFKQKTFENKFLLNPFSTRVNIKIQDGCNNRCSYCVIPFARGNSRSNSVENIIKQINIVIEKNIKEIVLTGIHIGQWGLEFDKKLIDLLKEIEKTLIPRYRLGSLYINELDDELISFLSKSKKFCPHFHLSLQSVCNKTLKNMNRNYSEKEIFETVKKLKKAFKLPFLGCDIIVGFPYEDDNDFNLTYNNLKKLKLSYIHCFPYSRRKNTLAYNYPQIQEKTKTQRAKALMELSDSLHREFLKQNQNTIQEILIERKSPKTGLYSAVTRNYIKIHFKDEKNNLQHSLKTVKLSNYILE